MDIVKELEQFFETELAYTKVGLQKETSSAKRASMTWYCYQRGLGAVQFALQLGCDYQIAEAMFDSLKERLEELL